jgi:hypothetical protein
VTNALIGSSYCANEGEARFLVGYLVDDGLMRTSPRGDWQLTGKGRIAVDELAAQRAAATQGFVAMAIDETMLQTYEGAIAPAIRQAGYSPMMIAKKEHTNDINDEILTEIRRSAFVVADFTGQRGGLYFESGFALSLGLEVIWTCQKHELSDLHFDISHFNCIDWADPPELKERLQRRITALLGQGPVAS